MEEATGLRENEYSHWHGFSEFPRAPRTQVGYPKRILHPPGTEEGRFAPNSELEASRRNYPVMLLFGHGRRISRVISGRNNHTSTVSMPFHLFERSTDPRSPPFASALRDWGGPTDCSPIPTTQFTC